jgi:hypothetical protein
MENVGILFGHLVHFMAIWCNLLPFGTIYGHLVQFMAIWYNLWPFGNLVAIWYVSPVLVHCVEKNLATLFERRAAASTCLPQSRPFCQSAAADAGAGTQASLNRTLYTLKRLCFRIGRLGGGGD